MGLRQPPGILARYGLTLLFFLAFGCTFSRMPGGLLSRSPGSFQLDPLTDLKFPQANSLSLAQPDSNQFSSPSPVQTPVPAPLVLAMQRAGSYYERGL